MTEGQASLIGKIKTADTSAASKYILGLVLVVFIATYGISWYHALSFPYALEYEGTMLWAANQLAHGLNIYDPARLTDAPWAVITYPPFFITLAALLVKLAGPSFVCLRLVVLVAAIASAYVLYILLRRSGCSPLTAAIGPAYCMAFSPVFLWSVIGRPDMVAVAFSLLGFERAYLGHLEAENDKKWLVPCVVAGLSLALACFTKQTSLVCLLTCVLFLLWCKHFKQCLALIVSFSAAMIPLVVSAQLLSGGFVQNITIFGKTHWDSEILWRYIHFMNDGDAILVEIAFCVLLYCFVFKKQETTVPERLPYILFAFSLAQMIYIMGLPGSNGNHAIFPLLALSWWIALKASTLRVLTAQAILLGSLTALPALFINVPSLTATIPKTTDVLESANLSGKLVLSEDPYNNILSHSTPAMIDCAVFTSVWKNSPDKLRRISEAVEQKQFAAIIINCTDSDGKEKHFWPDSILTAVRQHYRNAGKLSGNGLCQVLWLPKQD